MLQERDSSGALPIHAACGASAGLELTQLLITSGGARTLAAIDGNGSLPLHLFCGSGPSLQAVQQLGCLYPGFHATRTSRGDWPVLTAASSSSSSLDVIYHLLRTNPGVVNAAEP